MSAAIRSCILVIVACAGLLPAASAAAPSRKPVTRTVAIDGVAFQPADLTVNAGDAVVWTNKDPFPHTVTATGGAFDSKPLPAGQTWKYRAQKKGDYAYVCTLHPTMTGVIHVK